MAEAFGAGALGILFLPGCVEGGFGGGPSVVYARTCVNMFSKKFIISGQKERRALTTASELHDAPYHLRRAPIRLRSGQAVTDLPNKIRATVGRAVRSLQAGREPRKAARTRRGALPVTRPTT